MIRRLAVAFIILFSIGELKAAKLFNRSLLEVDSALYTQRDFEIYSFLSEALFFRKGIPVNLPNQENWATQLELFKNEMLVNGLFNLEAQRLNSFIPTKEMLEASMTLIDKNVASESRLRQESRRLAASDAELRAQAIILLKVQGFLKSRANKVAENLWRYQVDLRAPWFARVKARISYRFFERALEFRKLEKMKS